MSINKKNEKKPKISKAEVQVIKEQYKDELQQIKKKRREKVELTREATMKLERLIPVLRDDAKSLGIQQIGIQILPKKELDFLAIVYHGEYNVVGKEKIYVPDAIQFSYDSIENLNERELRALAWHEFAHIIYGYAFPESAAKYIKDDDHYLVQETFCDEFAYRKFGDVILEAQLKVEDWETDKSKKEKEESKINTLQTIYAMRSFKRRYGKHEYWLNLADTLGIRKEIKYDPENSGVIGVKPKRSILKGMYHEEKH